MSLISQLKLFELARFLLVPSLLSFLLIISNLLFGFLLFHTLAELFAVTIGIIMFIVVWNTHSHIKNHFLLFIGIGYLWIAILDLFHVLTYKGMNIFDFTDANTAVQFWVYTRYLEAILILIAPLFLNRVFDRGNLILVGGFIASVIFYLSLYSELPIFFIEGEGLTRSKIINEYVIILLLLISFFIYYGLKGKLSDKVRQFILLSLSFTIIAEFCFTRYVHIYGLSNQIGHIFKFFSYWMIFQAIVRTTLKTPFSVMSMAAVSYEAVPHPTVFVDKFGTIKHANSSARKEYNLVSHKQSQLHKETHQVGVDIDECTICQHLKSGEPMKSQLVESPYEERWNLVSLTPIRVDAGNEGYVQISTNVTEQMNTEKKLHLADEVIKNLSEGIMVTDSQLRIKSVNKGLTKISGYSEKELINQKTSIFSSGRHSKDFYQAMWRSINETGAWQGEIWNKRKNGEIYPGLLSISSIKSESVDVTYYIAGFSDISKIKHVESQLEYLANHDSLTGLVNRLMFMDILEETIQSNRSGDSLFGLMFIDLDNFKNINDSLGHSIGDSVLIKVANKLKETIRENDIICRYGGDEFIILVKDILSRSDLEVVSRNLISSLESPIFHHQELPLFVGASIGICIYPDDGNSGERLIQYSDAAMFKAKDAGKNQYRFHNETDSGKLKRRFRIESLLRHALEKNEFYVVYQPKIDIDTMEIVGAEALVRWYSPELGQVYPDEFIPIAETTGVIFRLGNCVLENALEQVKHWRDSTGKDLSVAVNFSSKQFEVSTLCLDIADRLDKFNLPGRALEIEITESLLLNRDSHILQCMQNLSSLGVSIAVDDFGTGYSALNYFQRYPINTVKIDKSFIDGINEDPESRILVKIIVSMAHGLGMRVVAEGIETIEQLEIYIQEQGDLAQGYYFSKPIKQNDFISVLESWSPSQYKNILKKN